MAWRRKKTRKKHWKALIFLAPLVLVGLSVYLSVQDRYEKGWIALNVELPKPLQHASFGKSLTDEESREVFRYSVVPGGVRSSAEVKLVAARDLVVRDHYQGIDLNLVHKELLPHDMQAYVSYRVNQRIYWTQNKIQLHKGEIILTDGKNLIRGRGGNRISEVPQEAKWANEPAPPEFDIAESIPPALPGTAADGTMSVDGKVVPVADIPAGPAMPSTTPTVPVAPGSSAIAAYPAAFATAGVSSLRFAIPAVGIAGGGTAAGLLATRSGGHSNSHPAGNTGGGNPGGGNSGNGGSNPPGNSLGTPGNPSQPSGGGNNSGGGHNGGGQPGKPPIGPPLTVTPEPLADGLLLIAALGCVYYTRRRRVQS